MGVNSKRLKTKIVIEFVATEYRTDIIKEIFTNSVASIMLMQYPNEFINPGMGDFIEIKKLESVPFKNAKKNR